MMAIQDVVFGFRYAMRIAPAELAFTTATTLLQGLLPAVVAWLTQRVVSQLAALLGGGTADRQDFLTTAAVLGLAVAGQYLIGPFASYVQTRLNEKVSGLARLSLMEKAAQFKDLRPFEDPQFYNEIQLLQEQALARPSMFVLRTLYLTQNLITIAALLALLAPIAWWIPAVVLASLIPQVAFAASLQNGIWRVMSHTMVEARKLAHYATVLLDAQFAKEVRLFNLGAYFLNLYRRTFETMVAARTPARVRALTFAAALGMVNLGVIAACVLFIADQALRGLAQVGALVLFLQALVGIQDNLANFIQLSASFADDLLYMRQLQQYLAREPGLPEKKPGVRLEPTLPPRVEYRGVSFAYLPGVPVLKGISLTLEPGKVYAIVGENGAGKTSLVKLLMRFYDPTEGQILVNGHDLRDLDLDAWRRRITAVFQDFARYNLTVFENIALGGVDLPQLEARVEAAAAKSGIGPVVDSLEAGYQTQIGRPFGGIELSGGQWQKLALARGFMRGETADLVVLDEPTAALDPRSEHELYLNFAELSRGKTVLLITHRLASVQMADHIFVLKDGCVVEQGSHTELLRLNGEYRALWDLQAAAYNTPVGANGIVD
ncbi:ABC transporter ATP-binding protein [Calidithermus terrae]|nr:ABC transporter ATP-binding protein [Calidithermus terrae]